MKTQDTIRLPFPSSLLAALKRSARESQGQTLVETALTMMVLLMMIFGVIEMSTAMYNYHYLANAAHEAARYAIVRGNTWSTTCDPNGSDGTGYGSSMCTASTADVANFVQNRGFPGINIPASDVYVNYFSSVPSKVSTGCPGTTGTTANNAPGDIVQVTICYPFTLTLPGLPAYTWHLASTSQMVIAQ